MLSERGVGLGWSWEGCFWSAGFVVDGEYWRYGGGIIVGVLWFGFGFGVWVERTA